MSATTSSPANQARSARFLSGQRPKPTKLGNNASRGVFLPSLTRLGQLASWFGQDHLALDGQIKIDQISDVDQLIKRFLQGVNDHYFPINFSFFSGDEGFSHPAIRGVIPVMPKGFDNWPYDDPITLLMLLAEMEENRYPCISTLENDYPQFDVPWDFTLSQIPHILDSMELDEPLSFLSDLIKMIRKRTGTFFLDHSPSEYDSYSSRGASINWSPSGIEWLKQDWKIAKPIHKRAWQLIGWTMTDEEERTKVLMELILEAWGEAN